MENQKTKLEEFMKKQQHKQYNAAEIQQMLLDQALGWVVEEANDNDSLTEKVIEFSVVWHNKDGSRHSKVFKANKDPETKEYAPTSIGCFNNMHRI